MSATKNKIVTEAKKRFNDLGYNTISLNELAQHLEMSRGNLTYHFKDKESLLVYIVSEMWTKIEKERHKSRKFPSFENLHNEVQLLYRFQKEYAFIFLDPHLLNHSFIKKKFREMTEQIIEDNKACIAFAIKLGNMEKESFKGLYHNVSLIVWMLSFFWLPQQIIRGKKSEEEGEKMIWSILLPHFTEKGLQSFKSFFGEEYAQNLGANFEPDLSKLISF